MARVQVNDCAAVRFSQTVQNEMRPACIYTELGEAADLEPRQFYASVVVPGASSCGRL